MREARRKWRERNIKEEEQRQPQEEEKTKIDLADVKVRKDDVKREMKRLIT